MRLLQVPGQIEIFAREVIAANKKGHESTLPCICFLAGGPGFPSPRPSECPAWMKNATSQFRVILLDQRGTGQSSPITTTNLGNKGGPEEQARYLSFFRADSIVRDAEVVRKALVPPESYGGRWSLLGQSYGGFCCTTYLSIAPLSLIEVLMTGGIPPNIHSPCVADQVYRALYRRVLLQNQRYYERFPQDVALVREIVAHLSSQPQGGQSDLPPPHLLAMLFSLPPYLSDPSFFPRRHSSLWINSHATLLPAARARSSWNVGRL